ncbi:hypothetical protein [Pedobacter sp. MC2016-24]|uniref:hypothetical protein n=1 Tax=Pedobacter sp. MC2016-24 TaxID=2780090 RepID=UPI00187ECE20|nr:hypothetical protein [Pedobacter sp. MC2016-24]MBE9602374.1 hypothetical protein [Pedobacter sp. MC2016-24]
MSFKKIIPYLIILLMGACSSQKKLKVIQFLTVERNFHGQSVDSDSSSFKIAHYNNCTLYEVQSIKGNVTTEFVGDSLVNKVYPSKDFITRYFVVKNGAKTGIKYDSLVTNLPRKFPLDSLLEMLTINEGNLKGLGMDLGRPAKVKIEGANDDVLIEHYFAKEGSSTIDSIYRFYDKRLNDIGFSFSKKLDSEKKSKLHKISYIFLPTKNKNGVLSARSKIDFEIKKISFERRDQEKLIEVFGRFKYDSKNQL